MSPPPHTPPPPPQPSPPLHRLYYAQELLSGENVALSGRSGRVRGRRGVCSILRLRLMISVLGVDTWEPVFKRPPLLEGGGSRQAGIFNNCQNISSKNTSSSSPNTMVDISNRRQTPSFRPGLASPCRGSSPTRATAGPGSDGNGCGSQVAVATRSAFTSNQLRVMNASGSAATTKKNCSRFFFLPLHICLSS